MSDIEDPKSRDESPLPSLGPLESLVLATLWKRGDLTVREVLEELEDRQLAYTTVMTVLVRLFEKGFVDRSIRGKQFIYRSRIDRESFQRRSAHALAQSLVRDFGQLAIASFVEEVAKVSPERLRELRELANRTIGDDERS